MDRIIIGHNFPNQPILKVLVGVPLIYLPLITTIPFVIICVFLVKTHLRLMGAQNIRSYWDFVPPWLSHRYRNSEQIIYSTGAHWYNLRRFRWYWVFNCKLYCPLSVALFRYNAYLVKIVENWWCPFNHNEKAAYAEGAIDKSYWHLHEQERDLLHPEDRDNPIWNEACDHSVGKGSDSPGDEQI